MALRLGMPVGEMLARMSSAELTEWMAYFRLEDEAQNPKPKASDYLRAALAHKVIKKESKS